MKLVIASGKGGVGKSMLSSSLAILFSKKNKVVACDCDVDAPNLGLWLGQTKRDSVEKISTSFKAKINQEKCTKCSKCKDVCRFSAIKKKHGKFFVNPFLCEGCGACQIACPEKAIEIVPVKNGEIRQTKTKHGFNLIDGQLYPGETGSGKVVEELKKRAEEYEHDIVVLDSPAGIGCPVIASIRGVDYAVLVSEPTPSGFSDLKRIHKIAKQFQIPFGVVVNKWDINPKMSKKIQKWAGKRFLGKISYDKKVIDSIVELSPVLFSESKVVEEIKEIFEKVKNQELI